MAEFGYSECLIVIIFGSLHSVAYEARLVSPWVFWLDQFRLPPNRTKKVRVGKNIEQLQCELEFSVIDEERITK